MSALMVELASLDLPKPQPEPPPTALPEAAVLRTGRRPQQTWPALAGAAALSLLCAAAGSLGGVAGALLAGLAGLLAQPLWSLGLRGLGGERFRWQEIPSLALLWAVALAGTTALLAWPLTALRQGGSLGAALAVSAVAGGALLALWRTWPLWRALAREAAPLAAAWRTLADTDTSAWRGLGAAGLLGLPIAGTLLLAWPGLVDGGLRFGLGAACLLLWPLAHAALQRLPAPGSLSADALLDAAAEEDAEDAAHAAEESPDLDIALYDAARGGRVERALALLEAGADAHALPEAGHRDQRSLPMLAAVLPDLRLLRALIARGADLNAAHGGMTPLIAATRDSWHGRPDAVMTLLANGADPRTADADGNTALHHAARSSDPGVAALLRDAGAEIDPQNRDGATPLAIACIAGNWRLAKFLLERGAKPGGTDGLPALVAAASGDDDDPAGVQLLLRHKAKADARDRRGRTALHEAARAGHVDILDVLLAAGADVQARDQAGRTPLLEAAAGGRIDTLRALAAARADLHAVDADGRGALHLACRAEAPSQGLIRILLDAGIDPNRTDAAGRRAVDEAAAAGRWALVAAIDPEAPLPASLRGDEGEAPAAEALPVRPPLELLREALEAGRFDSATALRPLLAAGDLDPLLRESSTPPAEPQLRWLLRHGANPELRDAAGDTALHAWLAQGPAALPAVIALLRHGVSPAGAGGLARFLAACVSADRADRSLERLALELLERGADPFAPSRAGDPPLTLAVRLGWQGLIARLLEAGIGLDTRDQHGMTALHLAAALRREAILKQLIAQGASPAIRAADGQTPLGVALASGRRDLAEWLDWRHWPLPRRALRETDLPQAAMTGDADAVRKLIDLGLPVDARDVQGCTALLRAAGGGHRGVVELLLTRGANPQLAARAGATPLSAAVSMRQIEIVDRLIAAGAALEQRLPGNVTVLMLAAALGMPDVCGRLLAAGADIDAADAQGLTPLHCAALFGFTARDRPRLLALLDTLLLGGADPDARAAGNVTPLLLLLGARAEPGTTCDEDVLLAGVQRLLEETASLDARDPRGFGPLHLAALHGLLRVTRHLLRAGADPGSRDALNRTAREIAVMRGFVDVAGEFAPRPEDLSMARFLKPRDS